MSSLVVVATGLFLIAVGVYFMINPKLQGARDAKFIESEEVGSAEKLGARVGAVVLLGIGLFFVFLGL